MTIDRTLSEEVRDVIWTDSSGSSDAYHNRTRDDMMLTSCSISLDPDTAREASETEALESDLRRCSRCSWPDDLAIYIVGAKEYHAINHDRVGMRMLCNSLVDAKGRGDAVIRSETMLEANGIEQCYDCMRLIEEDEIRDELQDDD